MSVHLKRADILLDIPFNGPCTQQGGIYEFEALNALGLKD
jgi:hypothetical protein